MKHLSGKVVVITGAGSGIGRALAIRLAKEGCHLALSDIDTTRLQETGTLVSAFKVKVSCHQVDVSNKNQMYAHADEVAKTHGRVDMIINNAGVSVTDSVANVSYEDFEWLMGINFWGVVYGTKAFLPHLKKQVEGHVVNISSVNGFSPWPNHSPYCSSKFAVKGFTESLLQECDGSSIRVSCVHPGGIKTNIARNSRFHEAANKGIDKEAAVKFFDNKLAKTTADKAADIIVRGIQKNKRRILVGQDAFILDWMHRLFSVSFCQAGGSYHQKRRDASKAVTQ